MYAGEGVCALEPNEAIGEVRFVRATMGNIGVGGHRERKFEMHT